MTRPLISFRTLPLPGKTRRTRKWIAASLAVVAAIFLLHAFGWIGNTAQRIASEHGIAIPGSSRHLRCEGLLNLSMLDTGTMATFEVPPADVAEISRQFIDLHEVTDPTRIPAIGENRLPEDFRELSSSLEGKSKDGNMAYLQIYRVDEARCGICLRTIWN